MFGLGIEFYLVLMNILVRKGVYLEFLRFFYFSEICVSQWCILKFV